MTDNRLTRRNRSLWRGIIVYSEGRHSFPCTIRDWSDAGARVKFPSGQMFPSVLILVNANTATGHRAEVIWVESTQAGLKFFSAFSMTDVPDDLAYLRRFGISRKP